MSKRNVAIPPDRRIEFRMGINVGDVVVDGDDIFGDGVNVAARLEGLSEPGGICVSGRVQEDAQGKIDIAFDDAGERTEQQYPNRGMVIPGHGSTAGDATVQTLALLAKQSVKP